MGTRIVEYEALTHQALLALDKSRAVAFWAISPIEVHGPHLPLGTDVRIGEAVNRRAAKLWVELDPRHLALMLPPLFLGADALPLPGSLQVDASVLEAAILGYGAGLKRSGISALVINSNHGGPRHQIALEAGARRLARATGMTVVNPFGAFLNAMVSRDEKTLILVGLDPASGIGGGGDVHAANFETSLALAEFGDEVDTGYRDLPLVEVEPRSTAAAILRKLGALLGARAAGKGPRAASTAYGLRYAADLLDWIAQAEMPSYLGPPVEAERERGARALEGMGRFTLELLQRALAGEPVHLETQPLIWELRALARLPLG